MKPTRVPSKELSFEEQVAKLRARKALEAQAIAEGKSDIVTDRPLTEEQRRDLGIDRYFGDDEDEFLSEIDQAQSDGQPR